MAYGMVNTSTPVNPGGRQSAIRYPSTLAVLIASSVLGTLSYGRWYLVSTPAPFAHPGVFFRELLGWLACYYPWVLLAPFVFRLERRVPLAKKRWARSLVYLFAASFPFAYVASELSEGMAFVLQSASHGPIHPPALWWRPELAGFLLQQGLYATALAIGYLFRKATQLHEQEQYATQLALEKSQLEASLRQAELETLRMRLNPHFLFNSLQNISILAQQDAKTASQMLTRLGDLLRVALRRDSSPEATLETEIALTRAYVAIEKMRFGDRLTPLFDLGSGTEEALVPTFLLQPLVENAIKHGLSGTQQQGVIAIGSARDGESLLLTVRDNGIGVPSNNIAELEVGIGLGSTCDRLARLYPAQHEFSIHTLPEGGTEVRVVLPFKTKQTQAESGYAEISSADRR